MSFEDTVDLYRTLKDAEAETRRERKNLRLNEVRDLAAQGYEARALNGDIHWRIRKSGKSQYLDYWPSTGKWHFHTVKGRLDDGRALIDLLGEKLP